MRKIVHLFEVTAILLLALIALTIFLLCHSLTKDKKKARKAKKHYNRLTHTILPELLVDWLD